MTSCDYCLNLQWDEELEEEVCSVDMDEDEYIRLLERHYKECPYFRAGDEYSIVRKQN